MEVILLPGALSDLAFWKQSGNKIILKRIRQLLESIEQDAHAGIGKPEALKYELAGAWSRRVNQEHRLVYKVEENKIIVFSLRYHY